MSVSTRTGINMTNLGPPVVLGLVALDVVEALHAVLAAYGVERALQHGYAD